MLQHTYWANSGGFNSFSVVKWGYDERKCTYYSRLLEREGERERGWIFPANALLPDEGNSREHMFRWQFKIKERQRAKTMFFKKLKNQIFSYLFYKDLIWRRGSVLGWYWCIWSERVPSIWILLGICMWKKKRPKNKRRRPFFSGKRFCKQWDGEEAGPGLEKRWDERGAAWDGSGWVRGDLRATWILGLSERMVELQI